MMCDSDEFRFVKDLKTIITSRWTYITESSKAVNVLDRMVSERDEGEVCGKRVPFGDKRGFSQPVPEDTHPLPFSPENTEKH